MISKFLWVGPRVCRSNWGYEDMALFFFRTYRTTDFATHTHTRVSSITKNSYIIYSVLTYFLRCGRWLISFVANIKSSFLLSIELLEVRRVSLLLFIFLNISLKILPYFFVLKLPGDLSGKKKPPLIAVLSFALPGDWGVSFCVQSVNMLKTCTQKPIEQFYGLNKI